MSDLTWVPTSMREHIANLAVGESFTRASRLDWTSGVTREKITTKARELRNTLNAAMTRASNETGFVYTMETGDFVTKNGVVVVVVITRGE